MIEKNIAVTIAVGQCKNINCYNDKVLTLSAGR